ncbi:MAG: glycoside hydrolase family 3 N-terminal domain-containing protein [Eubacteriales bacterium]|nr:glycoside hydrolase family 3 N-terminal domain-containing protein [Eubacteriales bacterium]
MKRNRKRKTNNLSLLGLFLLLFVCVGIAIFALPKTSDNLSEISSAATTGSSESQNSTDAAFELCGVEKQAQEIMDKMTLEEKVGQMFIVRCPDTDAAKKVSEYHLGGYVLFGQDFAAKSKNEVIHDIQSYQNAAKVPLFIGVDEEGGTVNRISINPQLRAVPFWSPQELFAEGGFDLIKSDTEEKAELLQSLGVNLNLAPVCDVSQNPADFIYQRSFGKDAEATATYVKLVVKTMSKEGLGSVLKHFPGYGNNQDTHTGLAYDNRTYDNFANSDFLPFQAGISAGANMVLVSHNIVSSMDDHQPASLSPEVHRILREDLNFTGVIITDDLIMDGVRDFAEDSEVAVQAVLSGNDMLCCTDFELQFPAVLQAVQNGTISEDRVNESVLRILELKISLGIIDPA